MHFTLATLFGLRILATFRGIKLETMLFLVYLLTFRIYFYDAVLLQDLFCLYWKCYMDDSFKLSLFSFFVTSH